MFDQPYDALEWLCHESERPRIYALLRGGGLFHHPQSREFRACIALAERLQDEPEVVKRLIHHHDWRNQVIGNVVAVINQDSRYEQDYVEKLTGGQVHFPSPLAAGWHVIHTGETLPTMEEFLMDISRQPETGHASVDYGVVLSIYTALRNLSSEQAKNFETTPLFMRLKSSNYFPRIVETTENACAAYMSFNEKTG